MSTSRKELETAACIPTHGKEIHFGLSALAPAAPCTQLRSFINSVIDGASRRPLEKQGQERDGAKCMNESMLSE